MYKTSASGTSLLTLKRDYSFKKEVKFFSKAVGKLMKFSLE